MTSSGRRGATGVVFAASAVLFAAQAYATQAIADQQPDLSKLSIEELGDVQVTSVSKRPEALGQAASSIYVITHDEIARSGQTRIPEILRLAPNLEVYQVGASQYVITARGFSGAQQAQNFSNKLLVMIDGRSVYTPLYSGVYWDMQDVPVQDIERIEVISGPGATLWGANAVNGVINIITRKSSDTQGAYAEASAGNLESRIALRYGGKLSDTLSYRVYAQAYRDGDTQTAGGASSQDRWSQAQGGFRLDWTPSPADLLTLQGDAESGEEAQVQAPAERVDGENLTARWTHSGTDGSTLQLQTYFDRSVRGGEVDGSGFSVNTFDVELQRGFSLGDRNAVLWGGGFRSSRYVIDGTPTLQFAPQNGVLTLGDAFAQDTLTLTRALKLTLGVKVEDDPYAGVSVLPDIRVSWMVGDHATVWAAVSQAVRSPTPFDRDVVEYLGPQRFLIGGPDFETEKLTAYEAGTRLQPSSRLSLSVSAFYNVYDDLRSIELAPAGFLPLQWGNGMDGRTYGFEAWGELELTSWWRLSPSMTYLQEKFTFKPGSSGLLGTPEAADDPKYQASLKSSMDIGKTWGRAWLLDLQLRYVSDLPDPHVPSYVELNGRLAWSLSDRLTLALTGRNLLHERHVEYEQGAYIPRSVLAVIQCRF